MEQEKTNTVRVHRVGTYTTGISLVIAGILFILYEIRLIPNLEIILKLWPTILIGMGVEILLMNARVKNFVYDKGAIIILILMSVFAMMMAFADLCIRYAG